MGIRYLDETSKSQEKPGRIRYLDDPNESVAENSKYGTKNYVSDLARPALEIGGAMAGGAAGIPVAGPFGAAAGGAAGYAAGKSAADLLDRYLGVKSPIKSVPEAVNETVGNINEGLNNESTGALINPVFKGATKLAGKGAKKVMTAVLGPSAADIEARLARNAEIKSPVAPDDIAEKLANGLNEFDKQIKEESDAAWGNLLKLKSEPRSEIISTLQGIQSKFKGAVGDADRAAYAKIDEIISRIKNIKQPGATKGTEQFLDQQQIKQIVDSVGKDINWADVGSTPKNQALAEFRAKINQTLKDSNPEYADLLDSMHQKLALRDKIENAFRLKVDKGQYVPSDTTVAKIRGALKEGKSASQALLGDFKERTGEDLLQNMSDYDVAQRFKEGRPNGSRLVNWLATLGAATGAAAYGQEGAVVGGVLGGSAGGMIDKEGPKIAARLIDAYANRPRLGFQIPQGTFGGPLVATGRNIADLGFRGR